ncbi:hypothetical protein FEM48_Zijuj02G0072200 [Ziziphus jujuba var. spinosa]|uniref:Suppressor of disruption of TFIIS n=1 Tax=Ziziphus jujuba var. spinosa TaxID=714518 RepID=A0A978VUD0_ZIZJJ|nr:hypothetical protein FEM48_Zijuj02G0072200 [Ziziphus jujuba var. spinosa]
MEYENQYKQVLTPKYDCLLFDVDDTLYPFSCGFSKNCTKNIEEYMVQKLGIEETEVSKMNHELYKNYGTSMAGLKAFGYDFDNDDYHSYVHGRLPYEVLKPDHVLRSLLLSLPIRKVLFFDDSIRNIQSGKRIGLHTVLVGSSQRREGVDYAIESIHNIREAVPELWEVDDYKKEEIQRFSSKMGIETSVTA